MSHQLAKNVLPFGFAVFRADAKSALFIMLELFDFGIIATQQHIN